MTCIYARRLGIALAVMALGQTAMAQGSVEDYERAGYLQKLRPKPIVRIESRVAWSAKEDFMVYSKGNDLIRLDMKTGTSSPAADLSKVAKAIDVWPPEISVITFTVTEDDALWLFITYKKTARVVKQAADGKITAVSLGDEHPFRSSSLPATGLRSSNGGVGTTVYFVNRSGVAVNRHWVKTDGQRASYGTIAADAEVVAQPTTIGHAWLFTDDKDQVLCAFKSDADKPVMVIEKMPKPENEGQKEAGRDAWLSADGKVRAFVKDHNLFLREVETKKETQLSTDGTEDDRYVWPHWSPDGKTLIMTKHMKGQTRTVHVVESTPKDQLQPKLHSFNYLKPGDRRGQTRPRLFDVVGLKQMPLKDDLFSNPWAINRYHWSPDGKEFFFVYNQRGHQVVRLVAIDTATGGARTVVENTSKTFIDYVNKTWCHHVDETNEVIWMSERDGWNHLYLIDRKTGKVKNQITKGNWLVRGVDRVDEEKRQLWIRVLGVREGQDPYYVHYARVNFDGSGFTMLTQGDGTHSVEFSPKQNYIIDTYSRVDLAPVRELRRAADGKLVKELIRVDVSAAMKLGWKPPERFVAKGRDGKTDIYGIIFRPTNFDPKKTYPIIEIIYAGPHGQYVPKDFGPGHARPIAELGFIVVQIDGMGTNWRSKAFHDVCWKNLADAGFPDRKAWIRAAAKKYPYMDVTRVGIYGGSAGGQNAMRALIDHHDFYKAAVADCGCHDNRMDKIWWNEAWMGWPIDKAAYDKSSNAVQAHKMKGHLMLTVGEMDRNVDPASTMQVVDALIKADKDFDLIVFPGAGHGAGGSPYGRRRMWDFFVRHLYGKEPRH